MALFNQHFDQAGQLHLFDFDLCGYGWKIYDLAIFRWLQVSDDDVGQTYFKALYRGRLFLWQAYLKGYQSISRLTVIELSLMKSLVQLRQIWLMSSYIAAPNPVVVNNDYFWRRNFQRLLKDFQ